MRYSSSNTQDQWQIQPLFKWVGMLTVLAILIGSMVAFFLWSLNQVTALQWQYDWLLYLLPLSGILIYYLYQYWGKGSEAGNNIIIDAIHEQETKVPARMAPMVLLTTLLTHLFGGSAGREGTAVQMGGGMAAWLGRQLRLDKDDQRLLLMSGMSAGFAAVFGTPLAGAFFAIEVIAVGRIQFKDFLPCYFISIVAHLVCLAWGIHHTAYIISFSGNGYFGWFHFDLLLMGKTLLAAIGFGLAAFLFAETHVQVKNLYARFIQIKWMVPIIGALVIIGLSYLLNTRDYLGLGVQANDPNGISIVNAFKAGMVTHYSWFWKILFTAITLGSGFKGGEVTPLFFIGACLGNTLAWLLGAPTDLFAALGFIAVFAGATNTYLTCTIMGCELFGTDFVLYFFVACLVARYTSGYSSIYPNQRMARTGKKVSEHPTHSLKKIREHLKGK